MNSNEKKDKSIAAVGTIVVHALAILVLFLMAFRTPLPLPGEEGVEVDLGMMNQGMGNIQPEKPAIPQAAQPQKQASKSKEDLVTQNNEEAPSIEKPKNTKPKQEKPAEEPKPTVNQRALFKGNNNPQSGGSEGVTGQPGDQGNPNGLAGIKQYEGNGGKGNGMGYDLGGRGAKSLHRPDDNFSEEGTVVVDIWVNQTGKVVRAEVARKGTTIINSEMRQKAIQAALRSSFAADPNAPEEQHGTITYNFVINQ
jgi:TonB family protein